MFIIVGWVTVRIDKNLLDELKECVDLGCVVSELMCVG